MTVIVVETGTHVVPGDIIFSAPINVHNKCNRVDVNGSTEMNNSKELDDSNAVTPVLGCYARITLENARGNGNNTSENVCQVNTGAMRHIIASRVGVVQWEETSVFVYPRTVIDQAQHNRNAPNTNSSISDIHYLASMHEKSSLSSLHVPHSPQHHTYNRNANHFSYSAESCMSSSHLSNALGPQPNDVVHLRITRLTHQFAFGEIIAINGSWSSHRVNASSGAASLPGVGASIANSEAAFKGVIRVEDIRPFKPSKDQLTPFPPSLSFQPGDVVIAEVLSQSDVRQYQLSTIKPFCGVVEAKVTSNCNNNSNGSKLEHIPLRRDAMVDVHDHSVHSRWCPLIKAK